jgi:hypothetical protein
MWDRYNHNIFSDPPRLIIQNNMPTMGPKRYLAEMLDSVNTDYCDRLYQHSLRSQDSNKPLRSTQYLVWNFGPNSRDRGCTAQSSISENFDSRIKSIFLFYSYFGYPNCSRRTSRRFITPLPSPHPQFCDWTITATSKMQILIRSPTIHFYGYFNYSVAWGTT